MLEGRGGGAFLAFATDALGFAAGSAVIDPSPK
jgi:hypothetical protein